jgi:hypothetical protein
MLLNNLKITLRRLARQKTTAALHVFGLTLGMSVCLHNCLFLRHFMICNNYQHTCCIHTA